MKTCLYKPIFINPQAYFVFPGLYEMEPNTEDFVEQARFTGFLMITNLDHSDTLLGATMGQSNKIDLAEWAGRSIEISNYTDEGKTVLGRWELPYQTINPKELYNVLSEGVTITEDSIHLVSDSGFAQAQTDYESLKHIVPAFKFEINNLSENTKVNYYGRNSLGDEYDNEYTKEGVYIAKPCYKEGVYGTEAGFTIDKIDNTIEGQIHADITILK